MNILKKVSIHVFVSILLLMPLFAFAQSNTGLGTNPDNTGPGSGGGGGDFIFPNPFKCGGTPEECGNLMYLIVTILNNIVMPIAAVFCVVFIIYAGFKFVTAQGNPGKVQKARDTLMWALIGTGILLGAAGISKVVEKTVSQVVNYQTFPN